MLRSRVIPRGKVRSCVPHLCVKITEAVQESLEVRVCITMKQKIPKHGLDLMKRVELIKT